MNNPLLTILFCVVGALIGQLFLKKDRISTGLGIATGLSLSFAFEQSAPAYLLAILIFVPLLIWRRLHAQRQSVA